MPDQCSMTADTEVASHGVGSYALTSEQRRQSLVFSMERGSLRTVRYRIKRDGLALWASLLPEGQLAAWIAEAEAHESVHGLGSLLVKDHRFNVELLPWILRRADEASRPTHDCPASGWSMELGWHDLGQITSPVV
jgi:hypothetical protein